MNDLEMFPDCHLTTAEQTLVRQYLHDLRIREDFHPADIHLPWTKDRQYNKQLLLDYLATRRYPRWQAAKQEAEHRLRKIPLPNGTKITYDPTFEDKTVIITPENAPLRQLPAFQDFLNFIQHV